MGASAGPEKDIGTGGLCNLHGLGVTESDISRGWQTARRITSGSDSVTADVNDPATHAGGTPTAPIPLPSEGSAIMFRFLSSTAGACVARILLFPADPGTDSANPEKNNSDGVAAGWEAGTISQTTAATMTADSPSDATVTDQKVSPAQILPMYGARVMVAYITTRSDNTELVYKVI